MTWTVKDRYLSYEYSIRIHAPTSILHNQSPSISGMDPTVRILLVSLFSRKKIGDSHGLTKGLCSWTGQLGLYSTQPGEASDSLVSSHQTYNAAMLVRPAAR